MKQLLLTLFPLLFYQIFVIEGKSYIKKSPLERRVINGDFVDPSKYPHIVAIFVADTFMGFDIGRYNYWCTGSIIKYKWVLTAAHCLLEHNSNMQRSPNEIIIKINPEINKLTWWEYTYGNWVGVDSIFFNTNYLPNYRTRDDIALLKLKTDSYYNKFYSSNIPAFLPKPNEHFKYGWVAGLGNQDYKGIIKNHLLSETFVRILDYHRCREIWGSRNVDETVICVYRNMSDQFNPTCKGDSGSGLVQNMHGKRWTIFGLLSFGFENCIGWGPDIFTNVSFYLGWITNITTKYD